MGRALQRLSEILALAGGALMLLVVAMTLISIAGRYFFGIPVKGDYEITELVVGVAAFLFFPYTQQTGQNLIAEFFASALSERTRDVLDAIHGLIFAVIAMFLAWRGFEGLVDKVVTNERSMLVKLPVWWAYAAAVPSLVVLGLVCLYVSARLARGARD